jgi:hypothetical protein
MNVKLLVIVPSIFLQRYKDKWWVLLAVVFVTVILFYHHESLLRKYKYKFLKIANSYDVIKNNEQSY